MPLRTLTPAAATSLDAELLSKGSFSLDQLMELAGLSIAQALFKFSPPTTTPNNTRRSKVLIACGPGNNGGDGLVAARHLFLFGGYEPVIWYPKAGKSELFSRLRAQVENLGMKVLEGKEEGVEEVEKADVILDAIFGFSFKGNVREPFVGIIEALARTEKMVLAVDVPSGWDVEMGPPSEGCGKGYMPSALISLTAPKPLVRFFTGRHFIGGRFVGREMAGRYGFDVPEFEGAEQVVEVENENFKGGRL
ncbi:probable NAD(P)H-hydrate epimerase [Ramularia collo-cygni]|uniref:NAD(P)H-hydrate epimerase n=1 Tax=Ramularia collo-cygni TaxID=112498 RepID=A0A2D3V6P2_9PEZI|nr:probable NAD(P)H-hydrate epimerase [Ramularia collo-cygni]CZT19216.1 probable NAD(P)H-hydrate epimerase [Ramularia collo-cygni]